MNARDSEQEIARPIEEDPIETLERRILSTPVSQSVAPDVLRRFHLWCKYTLNSEDVHIERNQVLVEAEAGPLHSCLALAELLMALGEFDLAISLGEKLFAKHPMDHRVQDAVFRAKCYRKHGCVSETPGQELRGSYCPMPWRAIHVLPGGQIFHCCSVWLRTSTGNLFTQSIKDVWSSPEADALRQSSIDGDYRYCGKLSCPHIQRRLFDDCREATETFWLKERPTSLLPPTQFNLSYDRTCNLSCPSCRTDKVAAKGAELATIEQATDHLFDSLKHAERLEVTGSGDPFASKSFRRLLMALDSVSFPKLKITIMTNGLLMKRSEWGKFEHLHGMIDAVNISVDAATPETYRELRRGGEFDDLIPNLEFVGELRQAEAIAHYRLCFVVQEQNFREMVQFAELAERVGADQVHFQMLHDWGTYGVTDLTERRVHLAHHPHHEEFLGVLRLLPQNQKLKVISDFSYLIERRLEAA